MLKTPYPIRRSSVSKESTKNRVHGKKVSHSAMELSVIIVNYNVYEDVCKCVESVHRNISVATYEVIVVDNNSPDFDIRKITAFFPNASVLQLSSNRGFGTANNAGMHAARGDNILILNPDVMLTDNSLPVLLGYLERNPEVGVVAPIIRKPDSSIDYYDPFFHSIYSRTLNQFGLPFFVSRKIVHRKRIYGFFDKKISDGEPFQVDQVMGACMLVRREILEKVGGFDERFFLYEEESDWQLRIRKAGWSIVIVPGASVIHNHHSSTAKLGMPFMMFHRYRSSLIFINKHCNFIARNYLKFVTLIALTLKYVYFWVTSGFDIRKSKMRTEYYLELVKLCLSSRDKTLNSKYSFKIYP